MIEKDKDEKYRIESIRTWSTECFYSSKFFRYDFRRIRFSWYPHFFFFLANTFEAVDDINVQNDILNVAEDTKKYLRKLQTIKKNENANIGNKKKKKTQTEYKGTAGKSE